MSNGNKALFTGFIIGVAILGIAGFLFAPHLLALAGVGITHTSLLQISNIPIILSTSTIGVTTATFSSLHAGITVLAALIGGLGGGLIGINASKTGSKSTSQHTPPPPAVHMSSTKTNEYSPQLDILGRNTGKSFVESYKLEKAAKVASPSTPSP